MKRRIALGAVIAAVALMGSLDSARADHCRNSRRSFGYSSYAPAYNYGYSGYYRPNYSYGYNNYYRPSYGRSGISFSFGSGRSGFSFGSFGRSYGHRGHSHHGHSHRGHRH